MTRRLGALAGAAVAVRAVAALTLMVVAPDGSRNIRMARLILEGQWTESLTLYPLTHPLYPLLIAIGDALTGNVLFAACAISVVLGGLAVLPLEYLARQAWGERTATIASVFYIFLPAAVELHCDAMLEGPFMFFFFSAMTVGWSAFEKKSWERAVIAGATAAAAWLVRPEGAYLVPLLLLAAVLRPGRFALAAAPLALAVAWIVASPYQSFVREQTGTYGISASPFSSGILGLFSGKTAVAGYVVDEKGAEEFGEVRDIARYGRVGGPIVSFFRAVAKNLFYILAVLAAIGFRYFRSQELRRLPALYLMTAAGGFCLPVALAFVAGTPFSHRYLLVPCVLLLPVAAIGVLKAGGWIRHPRAVPAIVAVICLAMSVRDFRPKRSEKVGIKHGGVAIREKLGENRRILAMSRQVEYYADGRFVEFLAGITFDEVKATVSQQKVAAIALFVSDFRNVAPGMQARLEETYTLLGEYADRKGRSPFRVYLTGQP